MLNIEPGLYTSEIAVANGTDILTKPSLLPYPTSGEASQPAFNRSNKPNSAEPLPLGIAISQWHWLLLYSDRLVGISRATEKVVFEESIHLASDEHVVGLCADPVSRTFWICTNRSILEILVRNEDRDVWRAKLEMGDFAEALGMTKVSLVLAFTDR